LKANRWQLIGVAEWRYDCSSSVRAISMVQSQIQQRRF
jgi:hypothetical protein